MIVAALVVLAVGTYFLKATGPVLAAGRQLPPAIRRLTTLLPAALLAALVANQTFASGSTLTIDARAIGVTAAAIAIGVRAPFGIVVLVGAMVTAAARAFGLP